MICSDLELIQEEEKNTHVAVIRSRYSFVNQNYMVKNHMKTNWHTKLYTNKNCILFCL